MSDARGVRAVQIVDDHFLFAQALGNIVAEQPGWNVVGIAVTGPQALGIASERQPDVILLDYHLPGVTADALIPRLLNSAKNAKIIVLTSDTSEGTHAAALAAGAHGFVTKERAIEEVIEAMNSVLGLPTSPPPAPVVKGMPSPMTATPPSRPKRSTPAGIHDAIDASVLRLEGVPFARLVALERKLEGQPGIKGSWIRVLDRSGAELRVVHDGFTADLDRAFAQANTDLAIARR